MPPNIISTTPQTVIKVLLVEDDPMIQEMYSTMFNIQGFNVDTASNGIEGLDKAAAFKPDIILLDIMMPKMNGLQALEKLKQDAQLKEIPVIMLSNLADDNDIRTALNGGAIQYLVKSDYIPAQVADIVEQVVTGYVRVITANLHKPKRGYLIVKALKLH